MITNNKATLTSSAKLTKRLQIAATAAVITCRTLSSSVKRRRRKISDSNNCGSKGFSKQ